MADRDFIDFISDAQDDKVLIEGFLGANDQNELETFINKKGYSLKKGDIEKIWGIREKFPGGPQPSPFYWSEIIYFKIS